MYHVLEYKADLELMRWLHNYNVEMIWKERKAYIRMEGTWGRSIGCEGFTEKVAFKLRPEGWCNLARNAEGERHCKQRDCHVQRGRGRKKLLESSGYWKDSCVKWKWDPGLHPSQNLAMVPNTHHAAPHSCTSVQVSPLPSCLLPFQIPCKLPLLFHDSAQISLPLSCPALCPITQHATQSR